MGKDRLWTNTTGFAKNCFTVFNVLNLTSRLNMGLMKIVTLGHKTFYSPATLSTLKLAPITVKNTIPKTHVPGELVAVL